MEGSRFVRRPKRRALDDRIVSDTMRLARKFRRRPVDPALYLVMAALAGFTVALLLGPRGRR